MSLTFLVGAYWVWTSVFIKSYYSFVDLLHFKLWIINNLFMELENNGWLQSFSSACDTGVVLDDVHPY